MGLFIFFKKEKYINYLASTYKLYYGCGDMAAIECMRNNYSADELKEIIERIEKYVGGKSVHLHQIQSLAPFKEDPSEVSRINMKHGGN